MAKLTIQSFIVKQPMWGLSNNVLNVSWFSEKRFNKGNIMDLRVVSLSFFPFCFTSHLNER